ncbi:MAG: 1-acyl-sn-glycerol-3-phosphate acyltransferase [Ruminococcaceae bacterium]|nr:1-acyl-sn-glycerol-3-phosphate acyltransferase [Oscillospiraceae bacterium]
MKENTPKKTIYYTDELNDEFSKAIITPKKIDSSWKYVDDRPFKKFTHFFWYRIIATPLAWVFLKIKFGHKIIGRELLPKKKKDKRNGFFIYGNHTQDIADALIPSMLCFPKDVYVVVHPNNVSMPFLGRITPSMGALPLPEDMGGFRNLLSAIKKRVNDGNALCIYPEAHIWPYYTSIRPFPDDSFGYPVNQKKPVYCFTNTYQKTKSKVRIVTYIDGPFLPDETKSRAEQKKELRDIVYKTMTERSKNSNIKVIEYIRRKDK